MKTKGFVFSMVFVLIVLVPLCVSAQNNKFYLTAKPGIYSPQTNYLEGFDAGFNGEIGFGYQPNKNFAAEMGLGYFATKGKESYAGRVDSMSYSATGKIAINVVPVTLTLKAIYPIDKWELFALGGIGAYFVSTELKLNIAADGISISDTMDDSTTIFGGHLGLGFHYNITPRFFLGVEGKYLWTSEAKTQGELFTVPFEAKGDLNGIIATAVLGLRF